MSESFPSAYVPVRELGRGGFGAVWEAVERGSGLTVVIKIPTIQLDLEGLARFRREIRLQIQLEHKNILPVLDFDVESSNPWFAAPKADCNFDEALPSLTEGQALALLLDVVRGVSHAHRNRVLHRDIKPQNVLVYDLRSEARHAKVSDFGLGRNFIRDTPFETATGVGIGTYWFTAPEQWLDLRSVDHRADIFSLGRLLEYLLTVVVPADSPLVGQLDYCIRTATANSPEDRYQNIDEFANDLTWILNRPRSLQKPVDTAMAMIQALLKEGNFDGPATRELAGFLLEHRQDYRLMLGMLPRIPVRLWAALIRNHVAAMRSVVAGYAYILQSPLAVDSAMAAMRLLEEVLDASTDDRIRELGLMAVVELAVRYDVAEFDYIATRCIAEETSASVIQALARHLRENPAAAEWGAKRLGKASLPPLLQDAIRGI